MLHVHATKTVSRAHTATIFVNISCHW